MTVTNPEHPGQWLGAEPGYLLAGAIRVVERNGAHVATLALPDGQVADRSSWTPDGRALLAQAVSWSGDNRIEYGWRLIDQGLYRIDLDGRAQQVHTPAGRFLQLSGDGWAVEYDGGSGAYAVTSWATAGPPLPPEPLTGDLLLLPSATWRRWGKTAPSGRARRARRAAARWDAPARGTSWSGRGPDWSCGGPAAKTSISSVGFGGGERARGTGHAVTSSGRQQWGDDHLHRCIRPASISCAVLMRRFAGGRCLVQIFDEKRASWC